MVGVTTLHFGKAQSGTNVNGIITSDTTWTQANSPYTLTGNVLVNESASLTVEPGATVDFNGFYIQLNGSLIAQGTPGNPIIFNIAKGGDTGNSAIEFMSSSQSWNETTKTGSIIENAIINSTWSSIYPTILIDEVSPKIDNTKITCTSNLSSNIAINIEGSNAAPTISNNSIVGEVQASGGTVCNNTITGSLYAGIYLFGNATAYGNTISGSYIGIYASSPNLNYYSSSSIQGNLIVNDTYGIELEIYGYADSYSRTLTTQNNTITNNEYGMQIEAYSSSAIYSISNNNIYDNINYNFLLTGSITSDINATNNWWGTTDTSAINQTIYDFKDDFTLGSVSFVPLLNAPNPQAPTYIAVSAGAGGSISPSGIIRVNYGGSQSFTITPDVGYAIADVLINGTSVGAVSSYTAQNIQAATTISATFAPNPTPTPSPTPSPTPISVYPSVRLDPSIGSVGTGVVAELSGFPAYATIIVTFGTINVGTLTSATGSGNVQFTVPQVSNGMYNVTATCSSGGVATEAFFVGQQLFPTPTPVPHPNATPAPSSTPTPNLPSPNLSFYCISSTASSGFNVQIQGSLTYNGVGLSDAGIQLSDSVTGGRSWQDLTYVNTDSNGSFTCVWNPSVSGNYGIEATWPGDSDYSNASAVYNFAIAPFNNQNQNVFSVTSNSTLTSLTFNSATNELSFGVSGPSGTTGLTKVCIPQSLIPDISKINVTLDGSTINYTSFSEENVWILTFTYHHSSHTIAIALGSTTSTVPELPYCTPVIITIFLFATSIALVFKKYRSSFSYSP